MKVSAIGVDREEKRNHIKVTVYQSYLVTKGGDRYIATKKTIIKVPKMTKAQVIAEAKKQSNL